MRLVAKVGLAAAAAGTTVGLFAIGMELWDPPREVRTGLVVSTGTVAFVSSVYAAVEEYRSQLAATARERVAFVLRSLALDLHVATRLEVRDLGVSAYVRRRRWLRPWRERLVRLHRERAAWCSATSGIGWRPGVGVIGRCVVESKDIAVDLAAVDRVLRRTTRKEWSTVDPDLRLGLSWREYEKVRGKYGVVLASPIIDDRVSPARVVGCVAVDAPSGSRTKLTQAAVRERVASAGIAILRLVL